MGGGDAEARGLHQQQTEMSIRQLDACLRGDPDQAIHLEGGSRLFVSTFNMLLCIFSNALLHHLVACLFCSLVGTTQRLSEDPLTCASSLLGEL